MNPLSNPKSAICDLKFSPPLATVGRNTYRNTMSILVTGAYGQLGKELCRQLGAEAQGVDVDTLDLTATAAIAPAVKRWRPAAVVNCAAYTQVDKAETETALCRAINAAAVSQLAAACAEIDCPLVQIGTDYVFSGPGPGHPWREADMPAPQGVYARTKFEGEQAAAACPKHFIVRTCGLYARASDAAAKNFVKTMLRLADGDKPLRIVNDQRCTPSYVPHVARAIVFLLRRAIDTQVAAGVYHVTNGGETTWFDFAAEIFRVAGKQVSLTPITTVEYNAPAPRPAYSVLDTARYHRLGGPAMPAWQEAVRDYFDELGGTL